MGGLQGRGLFGKYKGLWYWGPVLAGSEAAGTIIADYAVKPLRGPDIERLIRETYAVPERTLERLRAAVQP